ncbi:MAG: hypothetical protein ICV79_22560 [Flavisolibacter sp.]|nr:hypothetical protein [Flavisolibacter sp.]
MKMQHIAVALTVVNLAIMTILLAQMHPARAQQQEQKQSPVLRGRALEIVDSIGKVRASISILPPVEVDGKKYPETVLLRLIDNQQKPLVKLGAAGHGSGLSLSDEFDGGVLIHARDTGSFVKITNKGKERVIKP